MKIRFTEHKIIFNLHILLCKKKILRFYDMTYRLLLSVLTPRVNLTINFMDRGRVHSGSNAPQFPVRFSYLFLRCHASLYRQIRASGKTLCMLVFHSNFHADYNCLIAIACVRRVRFDCLLFMLSNLPPL